MTLGMAWDEYATWKGDAMAEAVRWLAKANELEPNDPLIKYALARPLTRLNREETLRAAEGYYDEILTTLRARHSGAIPPADTDDGRLFRDSCRNAGLIAIDSFKEFEKGIVLFQHYFDLGGEWERGVWDSWKQAHAALGREIKNPELEPK
jgi:hypothetical protein